MNLAKASRIFRIWNLLIVALTMSFFYFIILRNEFLTLGIQMKLSVPNFLLTCLVAAIITFSGYLINDIFDRHEDAFNKPEKNWIKSEILLKRAWIYYFLTLILGGIIALYISVSIQELSWFLLYPAAILILYIYANFLKSTLLFGNIIVSVMSAFIPVVLWFAEYEAINSLTTNNMAVYQYLHRILIFFLVFAFIISLIREIIKDIEDVNGDKKAGKKTLSTEYGVRKAHLLAIILGFALNLLIVLWINFDQILFNTIGQLIGLLMLALPALYFLFKLVRARSRSDFTDLSKFSKALMAFGLILILIISYI